MALQRSAGNSAVVQMLRQAGHPWAREGHQHSAGCGHQPAERAVQRSTVPDVLRSPGRPLDDDTRAEMEARLGADFSDVRLHTDTAARTSAAEIGARAYTSGSHVVIGAGSGDKLTLAHELTHVIQQRGEPVSGTDHGDGLRVSDPSDRFERAAEANAARVMSRAVPPGTSAGEERTGSAPSTAPAGTPVVARLMSPDAFRHRARRSALSRGVDKVDAALGAYSAIPPEQYQNRVAALDALITECRGVLSRRLALNTAEEKRTVELLLREAEVEREVCAGMIVALARTSPLEKLLRLYPLHEIALKAADEFGGDVELSLSPPGGGWDPLLTRTVAEIRTQDPAALVDVVKRDVAKLRALKDDPTLPETTRQTLEEVLGHENLVDFKEGLPGTDKNPAGSPEYTLKHGLVQGSGQEERLGSLAHELTHVAAGQAYDNTRLLLLFQRGLPDAEVISLAHRRNRTIHELEVMSEQQGFTPRQVSMIDFKLRYAKGDKLGTYASNFRSAGKIDQRTADWARRLAAAIGDGSSTLVEYDTVLTQLLTYLHMWKVPASNAFHARVLALAEQAQRDRRDASRANFADWQPDSTPLEAP
ncbi:DUF4157 domain-containing protein [Streptomyces sp. NPDC048057]|uniref:DUF4157 domain-containing protein n=1 Tax=Streptomyces sp. NPDC048057 TaxID=3155628 RepID=UPI0033C9F205